MQDATTDDVPLTTDQAADFLTKLGCPTAAATLETQRTRGGGPPYIKSGRHVRYRPSRLRAHADRKMCEVENTAQVQAALVLPTISQIEEATDADKTPMASIHVVAPARGLTRRT